MAFQWKEHKDVWKGEGVYHLTFAVVGRGKLLGELVKLEESRFYLRNVQRSIDNNGSGKTAAGAKDTCTEATVDLKPLGLAVSEAINALPSLVPGITICAKQIMPDHLHVVIWIKAETGRSIRQIGNGFRIGIKRKAAELGIWPAEAGHVLEIPFMRTLVHRGQLRAMIDYVHANPDDAWMRKTHRDYYTLRRNIGIEDLHFDMMGKSRLLDWPERQVIALSRSLTQGEIETELRKALFQAEMGFVTYTAAISTGEKTVAKAIREKGYPLVVMLLDGFPPEDSEAARYFHPSGVYHKACGEGRLLLLAPKEENYANARLIALSDAELRKKDEAKGREYRPIPHDSKRWRMIAGNVMLRIVGRDI